VCTLSVNLKRTLHQSPPLKVKIYYKNGEVDLYFLVLFFLRGLYSFIVRNAVTHNAPEPLRILAYIMRWYPSAFRVTTMA
jgi:hypothetical protein